MLSRRQTQLYLPQLHLRVRCKQYRMITSASQRAVCSQVHEEQCHILSRPNVNKTGKYHVKPGISFYYVDFPHAIQLRDVIVEQVSFIRLSSACGVI